MKYLFLQRFFFEKKYQIVRHILFWTVVVFALIALYGQTENNFFISTITTLFILPIDLFFTYSILLWLLPNYLLKEKYIHFCLLFFAVLLVSQFAETLVNHYAIIPTITRQSPFDFELNFSEFFDWYKVFITGT